MEENRAFVTRSQKNYKYNTNEVVEDSGKEEKGGGGGGRKKEEEEWDRERGTGEGNKGKTK